MDEKNRAKRDTLVAASRQVKEEKNKFAQSALRRVMVKLDGREPDSLRKVCKKANSLLNHLFSVQASVGEQVDSIILEAMK